MKADVPSLVGIATALFLAAGTESAARQGGATPVYGYRVVNTFPHDRNAFTQGLIYRDGFLFESTGQYGQSSVRKVRLETGQIVQQQTVDAKYFAEGLTDWGPKLLQLTWQGGLGFVYDRATFKAERTFSYSGQGWGLTHDTQRLILSDGSEHIRFFNPATFAETGRITVTDRGAPITQLNELEFIKDEIYANVWHQDRIARITPATGKVSSWIDLAGLLPAGERSNSEAVLNGIAYDAVRDRLFVTGKLWPKLFEIQLVRK